MFTIKQLLFLTISFAFFALALCDNTLSISQIETGNWEDTVKGKTYSVWEVTLKNMGSRTIYDATVVAESGLVLESPEKLWSMEMVSANKYHFPGYLSQNGGLTNGTKHTFGYINQSGSPAVFSICDIKN